MLIYPPSNFRNKRSLGANKLRSASVSTAAAADMTPRTSRYIKTLTWHRWRLLKLFSFSLYCECAVIFLKDILNFVYRNFGEIVCTLRLLHQTCVFFLFVLLAFAIPPLSVDDILDSLKSLKSRWGLLRSRLSRNLFGVLVLLHHDDEVDHPQRLQWGERVGCKIHQE